MATTAIMHVSFDGPVLSHIGASNLPESGIGRLYVSGLNFGYADLTVTGDLNSLMG
jgi:hypothetical protein